jgi:hypothetical protein
MLCADPNGWRHASRPDAPATKVGKLPSEAGSPRGVGLSLSNGSMGGFVLKPAIGDFSVSLGVAGPKTDPTYNYSFPVVLSVAPS